MSPRRQTHHHDESDGGGSALLRALWTLLVLAAIGYIAAHLLVRTAGFRQLATERLETHWGIPIDVDELRLTPGGALIIEGLTTRDFDGDGTGFTAATIRLDWRVTNLIRRRLAWDSVRIINAVWSIQQESDGRWPILVFGNDAVEIAAWTGLPPDALPSSGVATLLSLRRIDIQDTSLLWWTAAPSLLAGVHNLNLTHEQTHIMDRDLRLTRFSADRIEQGDMQRVTAQGEKIWLDGREITLPATDAADAPL